MIDRILEAGRAAPIGCNMGHLRFVVLKDPEEKKLIWSDINTKNAAVIIVVCHDKRVPPAVGQDRLVPQNAGYDAAAAPITCCSWPTPWGWARFGCRS